MCLLYLGKLVLSPDEYLELTGGTPIGEKRLVWSFFGNLEGERPWQFKIEFARDKYIIWIRSKIPFGDPPLIGKFIWKSHTIPTSGWLRIDMTINPVVDKKIVGKKNSSRIAIKDTAIIDEWAKTRLEKRGLFVKAIKSGELYDVLEEDKVRFKKSDVQAVVEIVDADKFAEAMCSGIGDEKCYGCGMICVTKICEPEND